MEHSDLVLTSSKARLPERLELRRELTLIGGNAYTDSRKLHGTGLPWEIRMRVAEARIIFVQELLTRRTKKPASGIEPSFTGESALVILGLQPWWNNPDVMVRRATRSGHRPEIPAVRAPGASVAGVQFTQIRHGHVQVGHGLSGELSQQLRQVGVDVAHYETSVRSGLLVAPAHLVAYDLCRLLHPLQAFHDVSMLLRHLARWDSRDLAASKQRLTTVKQAIRESLEQLGAVPGIRRTRVILSRADAGIESPAETIVLWTLLSIVKDSRQISTQIPVRLGRNNFRIDLGIPAVKLAIEVTGRGKFGDTSTTAHDVASRFLSRQQMLETVGWRVVNITYDQAKALPALMKRLREVLSEHGIPTTVPNGLLWEAASQELMARNRRF